MPFLAATTLALLAFAGALAWLPEARTAPVNADAPADLAQGGADRPRALWPLLALAVAGQFGLAIFESTFALYGNRMWNYGPSEIGAAFMACGLVMTIAQIGVTTSLARRAMGELTQVALGFGMVGAGLALLSVARGRVAVLAVVAVLALGLALIAPNLAALIAMRSSRARTGRALGIQSAANSVGLVLGTLAGGGLLAWQMEAPFLMAGHFRQSSGRSGGASFQPPLRPRTEPR